MVGRISVTESTYRTLTERILSGVLPPGARIDANEIAAADGVSATPVRNALNRLVGAGLLVSHSNEGFFVPPCSEHDLRDLYDCCAAMLSLAVARTANNQKRAKPVAIRDASVDGSIERQTEITFQAIMSLGANKTLGAAFAAVNIRLRPARILECDCIGNQDAELRRIRQTYEESDLTELDRLINVYHRRRIRLVPKITERMQAREGEDVIGDAKDATMRS